RGSRPPPPPGSDRWRGSLLRAVLGRRGITEHAEERDQDPPVRAAIQAFEVLGRTRCVFRFARCLFLTQCVDRCLPREPSQVNASGPKKMRPSLAARPRREEGATPYG